MGSTLLSALIISGIGLGGVFATLVLFYFVTRLLLVVAAKLPKQPQD
jgi:hypothetical protein